MSVRVRDQWYFPLQFRIVAVLAVVVGVAALIAGLWTGLPLIIGGALVATMHYGFEIDRQAKRFKEYVWILGWQSGKYMPYLTLHYLFVNAASVKRTYNLRVNTTILSERVYNGYLKISDAGKIHVIGSGDKKRVLAEMKKLKQYLDVRLVDHTSPVSVEL